MNKKKKIVLAICIIIGIALFAFYMNLSAPRLAMNSPVTEEYCDMLRRKALELAKTLDKSVIEDDEIKSDYYYTNDELIVLVESNILKVTAKAPVSNQVLKIEDGVINLQGEVNYEAITYQETETLKPFYYYILLSLGVSFIISYGIYTLIDGFMPKE